MIWTLKDAAAAWGIGTKRIAKLIRDGRVKDAQLEVINGRATWTFPPQDKPPERKSGPRPKRPKPY